MTAVSTGLHSAKNRSSHLFRIIAFFGLTAAILIAATFYGFTKGYVWDKKIPFFQYILILDGIVSLLAASVLIRQLYILHKQKRKGLAGSRLHSRIVMWLSWIAVLPPVIIATLSWVFFSQGIQTWFSDRVRTALEQSTSVAEAYLEEHKKVLAVSAEAMALDIEANWASLRLNSDDLEDFLNAQTQVRSLNEAILFDTNSRVWARSHLTVSLDLFEVFTEDLNKAQESPVVYSQNNADRVRALVQVIPNENIYLLVGRYIDPKILQRIQATQDARSDYFAFQTKLERTQITFALMFTLVTLLILVLSAWAGLWFAEQIASPIAKVIAGAESISQGNLQTHVAVETTEPDIRLLANTFNRMIKNVLGKQQQLLEANEQIDERRQFIQSVLGNVSTGVVSLDAKMRVTLVNARALEILQKKESACLGAKIVALLPELLPLAETLSSRRFIQGQIDYQSLMGKKKLLVRMSHVTSDDHFHFIVLTFDDLTDLIHAQRQSAWSDVARRIAHEIKNPLTPIQLSAERLRKRYSPQISEDIESFNRCLDTIAKQVDHIGHLVSEFSAYAKMPQPVFKTTNFIDLVVQTTGFYQDSYPKIQINFEVAGKQPLELKNELTAYSCDGEQIQQVLANLIQNAVDALQEQGHPQIMLRLDSGQQFFEIGIHDNGPGFPSTNREELLDPYVTYKENGTGLGLAIVKKIILDHDGNIELLNSPLLGGAYVKMRLPRNTRKPQS